ncbi:general substrate transporter [Dothidotthia symphoricarpi CBS 119687]|uniref:General substrate transporter n=1 Tax=Dothidotthia symphoricarpi CBS 119687 TaxID=1392245 RepID=A0A6A6A8K8_9PLEO|nr:general substrate transporter [Dothidotthia symphoricarpi CBS 119687]KAF2127157.1 general substrate transporter [Dothidotthia symphoricarpi CBS 119687]
MTDTAAEPLIPETHHHEDHRRPSSDSAADFAIDENSLIAPGAFIWGLTISAGVSDLSNRPLTTLDKSLITSCTSFFALLASPLTGILADTYGRKTVILAADILFVVGALWQACTSSVAGMIAGRSIVGAAVGSASFVVPLYISEVAPSPFRGRLVTVSSLFITAGQVVAYVIGWVFSAQAGGWRWIVGLGALPAAVQFCMLFAMPETPRYLVKVGRREKARQVLKRVYGDGEGIEGLVTQVLRRVEKEILEEEDISRSSSSSTAEKNTWKAKLARINDTFTHLTSVEGNRRALVIACMLQGFQQLCGFNSLMYFSATIFHLVGFTSPTLTSLSIALTNFLFTLLAFHAIDRIGRRRILLLSLPIMALGLALCAIAFHYVDMPTLSKSQPRDTNTNTTTTTTTTLWPLTLLTAMTIYVASYAVGLGNVPWQQSELFPLSVRSLGSALATATNWASNTLVGLTFLPMMEFGTPAGTFALYAGVCAVAWGCVWGVYPETAGLGLEDVGGLLAEGWGVEESVRGFRARRGRGG